MKEESKKGGRKKCKLVARKPRRSVPLTGEKIETGVDLLGGFLVGVARGKHLYPIS